jgi:hypothetical protein
MTQPNDPVGGAEPAPPRRSDETRLVWIDMEMTGLRPDIDRIIAQQEHFIARQDDMMARQQLHGTRLAELQQDYQDERQERREDVADLRQTFTRKLSDLAAQIERK